MNALLRASLGGLRQVTVSKVHGIVTRLGIGAEAVDQRLLLICRLPLVLHKGVGASPHNRCSP